MQPTNNRSIENSEKQLVWFAVQRQVDKCGINKSEWVNVFDSEWHIAKHQKDVFFVFSGQQPVDKHIELSHFAYIE